MWVFLSDAMLSIVRHREDPRSLLVRARQRGDIERVFPHVLVTETPEADYRFRAKVHETVVAAEFEKAIRGIDYDNFKGSVANIRRHDAYMGVWSIMHREQQREVMEEARARVKPARRPAAKRARAKKAKRAVS
jgi:hypothetical protein